MAEKPSKVKVRINIQAGTALVFDELTNCFLLPSVLQWHGRTKSRFSACLRAQKKRAARNAGNDYMLHFPIDRARAYQKNKTGCSQGPERVAYTIVSVVVILLLNLKILRK